MGVSFTGLASGIDSAALIDAMVNAEKSQANTLTNRQSDLNAHKSIVSSLSSLLSSLSSVTRGMSSAGALVPRGATASDSKVTVAASSGAMATTHSVRVESRARAQVSTSNALPSQGAGAAGAGSLDITVGATTKQITWTNTDTLANIASKINDAGAGVTASVLNDGTNFRLVLAAQKTGTAAAPTFVETGTMGFSDAVNNITVPAKDAKVVIDGVPVTRPTNTIDDAITGLTLTIAGEHAVSDTPTAVAVTVDSTALTTKVEQFVAASNAINSSLHVQLDYTGTKKGTNTLFGDSTLLRLQSALNSVMGGEYGGSGTPGTGTTLSAIGITRDRGGTMTLDKTKLAAAIAANPAAVEKMFVTDGLGTKITKTIEDYTRSSDGAFAAKSKSIETRFAALSKQIERINNRADMMRSQLEAQFTAMEASLSKLKSQGSFLSSIL